MTVEESWTAAQYNWLYFCSFLPVILSFVGLCAAGCWIQRPWLRRGLKLAFVLIAFSVGVRWYLSSVELKWQLRYDAATTPGDRARINTSRRLYFQAAPAVGNAMHLFMAGTAVVCSSIFCRMIFPETYAPAKTKPTEPQTPQAP